MEGVVARPDDLRMGWSNLRICVPTERILAEKWLPVAGIRYWRNSSLECRPPESPITRACIEASPQRVSTGRTGSMQAVRTPTARSSPPSPPLAGVADDLGHRYTAGCDSDTYAARFVPVLADEPKSIIVADRINVRVDHDTRRSVVTGQPFE